ncbi:hypothetical protein [Primorskyibacter sedentarius]|uniref:hypothetical protein n=1 Tax=Primorskyibacter sedentarius TaxID=745311 RepID=UPI003EBF19FA
MTDAQTFLTNLYQLLESDPRTLPVIAREAGVNYHWLAKLKQRKLPNPGFIATWKVYTNLVARLSELGKAA